MKKFNSIQITLQEHQIDGWLMYDFRRSNDLICQFLEIPDEQLLSRRFYYWIPAHGEPLKIVSTVEDPLKHLPGQTLAFSSWERMEEILRSALKGCKKVAMEYSPYNRIPVVSKVDGGTIDLIRSFGVEVVSSCDILQKFRTLTPSQISTHLQAADILDHIAEKTWSMIFQSLKEKKSINEYHVQQFILRQFEEHHCMASDIPICAVNANSANPHYSPDPQTAANIKPGDFILIDLWCKLKTAGAVYADITRVGVAAENPSQEQQKVFEIVRKAQQAATDLVKDRFASGKEIKGWEIDQAARDVIVASGYGEYFVHRTGHNIDTSDHGSGANIDNLETQDQRMIIPGSCFSIEPGIYLPGKFGVRLEYDILVGLDGSVQVTGGIQDRLQTMR